MEELRERLGKLAEERLENHLDLSDEYIVRLSQELDKAMVKEQLKKCGY